MYNPVSLFIGLRYTRAKRRNHFISFISLASMIGIALGVIVLITVLSVMNGFDREIKERIFSMVPPVTVSSGDGNLANWQALQKTVLEFPRVQSAAPFATGEVLLSYGGSVQPAIVTGVLPDQEKKITKIAEKMVSGELADLKAGEFGIVLGEALANKLAINVGDKVTVITPQVSLTPAGVMPRYKRFTVVGLFRAGTGFGFDAGMGFMQLQDAQKLLALGSNVSGLHLSIDDVYASQQVANELSAGLTGAAVTTWADQFGELFHAIQLEKNMMFFILLLIVAIAAFNLVSTLVMVVNEKQADIAILRTFGATPRMIMCIFIVQGGLVGVMGTVIGVIGGVLLAMNVTDLVEWIQHIFHVQFLSSNVYFVNYLPSYIEWSDVVTISIASLILSLLATIYPAWRAAKLDPVESLRYE